MTPAHRAHLNRHIVVRIVALALAGLAVPLTAERPVFSRPVVEIVGPSVKWVRLRYRHLTQVEDYQTADMAPDPGSTRTFAGRIPASFIDPKSDLMYFVEVMGTNGRGRMYPDLERETPYVVVSVRR